MTLTQTGVLKALTKYLSFWRKRGGSGKAVRLQKLCGQQTKRGPLKIDRSIKSILANKPIQS